MSSHLISNSELIVILVVRFKRVFEFFFNFTEFREYLNIDGEIYFRISYQFDIIPLDV